MQVRVLLHPFHFVLFSITMTNHPLIEASFRASPAIIQALSLTFAELLSATERYGPQRSAHEGYGVILEELDELWDEIKKNDKTRSQDKMRGEAKQVAAMALRFMIDVCGIETTLHPSERVERRSTKRRKGERRSPYYDILQAEKFGRRSLDDRRKEVNDRRKK